MTFSNDQPLRRAGGRDDDGLARGRGRLHDAARTGAPDGGAGITTGPGPGRAAARAPTGRRPTIIAPTPTASASIARTTGSNAVAQYAPPSRRSSTILKRTPEKYLLWFHHLSWDYPMPSGRTLWDELVIHYSRGVEYVREMRRTWATLAPYVDAERYAEVAAFLAIQEKEARWWRDACMAYFQSVSKRPLPAGYAPPEHTLAGVRGDFLPLRAGQSRLDRRALSPLSRLEAMTEPYEN